MSSILGICKTQWANNGDFVNDKHWIIHTGSDKNERGVGLILDQDMKKCLLEYCQLSERIIMVRLNGKPFNISIIVVYAPTAVQKNKLKSDIPEDLSRYIFIALPKKPAANECELYRTLSLMTNMIKLI